MRRRIALARCPLVIVSTLAAKHIPWSLDRIDRRSLPLDGRFDRTGDGSGVTAYVIDTGVLKSHHEFGGRVERRLIRAGFVCVLSAGGVADLAAYTPQRVQEAIKVGSTTADDVAVQGYGPRLTLFAPGVGIEGAGSSSDSATFAGDGDSYAAPLVAGVAAIYMQRHPNASPDAAKHAVVAAATQEWSAMWDARPVSCCISSSEPSLTRVLCYCAVT